MSSKPNYRRGHDRIQDGGPTGCERKRFAVGHTRAKRATASRNRSLAKQDIKQGKPLPKKHIWHNERWRGAA